MIVNLMTVIIIVMGAYFAFSGLKREVFPQFPLNRILIRAFDPGAGPEEIERRIIRPFEDAIQDIEGLDEIDSTAGEGAVIMVLK